MDVPIFVDVDGVLNTDWWDSGASDAVVPLDPRLIENLGTLVVELGGGRGTEDRPLCRPRIVVSSTWRVDGGLTRTLLGGLAGVKVECRRNGENGDDVAVVGLDRYLYGRTAHPADVASVCGDADPPSRRGLLGGGIEEELDDDDDDAWRTPVLGARSSGGGRVETRLAEIRSWLASRPHRHAVYLILDDLNLLFGDDGRGTNLPPDHFVHTVDERDTAKENVGLTTERVRIAVEKVRKQIEGDRVRREILLSKDSAAHPPWYTAEEWNALKESDLPCDVLAKETCPIVVKAAASQYLREYRIKKEKVKGCSFCAIQ